MSSRLGYATGFVPSRVGYSSRGGSNYRSGWGGKTTSSAPPPTAYSRPAIYTDYKRPNLKPGNIYEDCYGTFIQLDKKGYILILDDFQVPEGATRSYYSGNPIPETVQPSPPEENSISGSEEIEQIEQATETFTPPMETEKNQEPNEEASASESENAASNSQEPPTKKRKKKKKSTNAANTTPSPTSTALSCSSPSEPSSQPETKPTSTSASTDETPKKDKETSNETEKALTTNHTKILIRGLPDDFDTDIIFQEFGKLDLKIHKIIQFKKRVGGTYRLLPLFLVIAPMADQDKIFATKSIQQFTISAERFRGGLRPKKCFRCQGFGPTQRFCSNQPRCMKCAEMHFSYQCKKDRSSPAKCCNCEGSHTSNFSGCEARPRRKSLQTKDTPATSAHRLVTIIKELQEILKNQEVLGLLQTLIKGSSPSE
ncbi:uncharacterized protein [Parasteatoda tepidariorum]|uniref:uncharacterized protein n=1 Tax=Parasteatoda tepidariorum TaxID=114398 RepID=UPI0039BC9F08